MTTHKEIITKLLTECYWTAGVSHSWTVGRGARRSVNRSIASVPGQFATYGEAMDAAQNAIEKKNLAGVLYWESAKPWAAFCIPGETQKSIGELLTPGTK